MIDGWDEERRVALAAVRGAAALCAHVRAGEAANAVAKSDRSPVTMADYGAQAWVCRALHEAFPDDAIVAEEDAAALADGPGHALLTRATDHVRAVLRAEASSDDARHGARGAGTLATDADALTAETVRAWIARGATPPADPQVDRFWVLDPIDGTKGFLRGDQYAIALALIVGGRVRLGLLACPALPRARERYGPAARSDAPSGVLAEAIDGGGTRLHALTTDPRLAPAGRIDGPLRDARVAAPGEKRARRFVESVEGAHGDPEQQRAVARATGIDAPPLRLDSQVKYVAVADGRAALYLRLPNPTMPDYREKIWDHAAGALIVQEAGGTVSDASGRGLDFSHGHRLEHNRGIVAGTPELRRAAVAALAAQFDPTSAAAAARAEANDGSAAPEDRLT